MAYDRILEVLIGFNNGLAVNISALNMSFDITRNYDIEDNSAHITIYNAKFDTRKKILVTGNNIIIKAGYKDEGKAGQIFSGIIIESSSRKNGTEWITEIVATDFASNSRNLLKETIFLTYNAGISIITVINDIIGILGVPIIGIENAANIILNNGFVFSGYVKDAVKKIEKILIANNVGLYFDNDEMVIFLMGTQNSRFGIVRVTQNSGLIGEVEDITNDTKADLKKRIAFTSLMNWKIKPNALINLNTLKINGLFIVEQVNFVGDNMAGDFFTNVEAVL